MEQYIKKSAFENILHKLWKEDTGFENIDIARIAYNRALQDIQIAIDSKQEEPVSEDLEEAAKQYSFYIPTQCEATETWEKETEQHFIDGAKWKKEQLMAKAIEGNVLANGIGEPILHLWDRGRHLVDKKVKVIVIEED